ncbi:hypothetical protein CSUI_001494 [Cystoisospora suis]|uniref:Uncharacterized protein n=1 Tax=Cystoisospora suis TaxID=483139 RepID=A0A2C6KX98_9APIC|nr:hypothetical protein CSUI_001494 [Cystoisospora suis]
MSRSPSLKNRLMLLVKAKDLQQQKRQQLEAQQQAASIQDPGIALRASRLQRRLSQPRESASAMAGLAAAGLASMALESTSVEMAGVSSSSTSPLVSLGNLSTAQISESIQMVSYQQGFLRDCLRLFCFFVLTYASAAARAKHLTRPRGSLNKRRSSAMTAARSSRSASSSSSSQGASLFLSFGGGRERGGNEEFRVENDAVFRECVDEFLQDYFSSKETEGQLLSSPSSSPMNGAKAQDWEIFDNLLILMMKLQACVYSRSELLSVVTAQWRASRQVQEGTVSTFFPSVTALKLLAEEHLLGDDRFQRHASSAWFLGSDSHLGEAASSRLNDEDDLLLHTRGANTTGRRRGEGASRRLVEAACGSYLCFALSASKLFENQKILALGLDDLLTFPDSTLRQAQLANMPEYLLLLHAYVREKVQDALYTLAEDEDEDDGEVFPAVLLSHSIEEMLQQVQWTVGGGENRCSEQSTIAAALWPAWMVLHRRQHPRVLIQAYMQLYIDRRISSSSSSSFSSSTNEFGLSEGILALILAWLFDAWLMNDESDTSSSTFLKVFNFHLTQGHLPCYDTPSDCLMHSRLSREQKRIALQASHQLKEFLISVSQCLSSVSTEFPYLKTLQQYKTLCSTLSTLQQPLSAYIAALNEGKEGLRETGDEDFSLS